MAMYLYVIYVQHVQGESGVLLYERMNLTLFYIKIAMIVVGLIYIILTIKILFRKGTNQELRWIALNRQFMLLFLFLFWHTMFSILFYDSNLLKKITFLNNTTVKAISIYMQVVGIPSAFIRLKEPFVWYRF